MDKNEVFEILVSQTKEVLPGLEHHTFSRGDRLVDLGANSIDRAEIMMLCLELLQRSIPLHILAKHSTLGELANAIAEH